jgi:hypothetical protein
MQRWIVLGVVALGLFLGGAYFAAKTYKQNRPAPIWVPIPINPELPVAQRDKIIGQLKKELSEPPLLAKVSKDLSLPAKWEMATDEQCAQELARRMFVRAGEADTPMGKVPAIHVGMNGKRKETEVSGQIALRLMDDVWPILGIDPPPKSQGKGR